MKYMSKKLLFMSLALLLTLCVITDGIINTKEEKYITIYETLDKEVTLNAKSIKVYGAKKIKSIKTIKNYKNSGKTLLEITIEK